MVDFVEGSRRSSGGFETNPICEEEATHNTAANATADVSSDISTTEPSEKSSITSSEKAEAETVSTLQNEEVSSSPSSKPTVEDAALETENKEDKIEAEISKDAATVPASDVTG